MNSISFRSYGARHTHEFPNPDSILKTLKDDEIAYIKDIVTEYKYILTKQLNYWTRIDTSDMSEQDNKQCLTWLERLELEKAMMGRGIDYETAEQILIDFQKRMDRF